MMSPLASHLLHTAAQLACFCRIVAAQYDDGYSSALGALEKTKGMFQLTGQTDPTMREVNGGRLCVNGFGKQPPGYVFSGDITLDQCADIAGEQPDPLGFRWGRLNFDYALYTEYARPLETGGNASLAVDLDALYPPSVPEQKFMCTIFVEKDLKGQPIPFKKSNSSAQFHPKLQDGPANSVCFQRWTMTEFFKPKVSELWFCYMTPDKVRGCTKEKNEYYFQGKIFIIVFLFFLCVLGVIMSDMPEFETPLVWFTRLLLNLELGMISVAFLLTRNGATESPEFFACAFVLDVVGAMALFCPYHIMEWVSEDSPFNTAYLLLLAFSPCFLMEFMSYWSHFILLVGHLPLLIGALAFVITSLGLHYYHFVLDERAKIAAEDDDARTLNSLEKQSYTSVPTEEPKDCTSGCRDSRSWKTLMCKR